MHSPSTSVAEGVQRPLSTPRLNLILSEADTFLNMDRPGVLRFATTRRPALQKFVAAGLRFLTVVSRRANIIISGISTGIRKRRTSMAMVNGLDTAPQERESDSI